MFNSSFFTTNSTLTVWLQTSRKQRLVKTLAVLLCAIMASSVNARELQFADNCETFNLSSRCAPPPAKKPQRTDFIKDEVVLLYSSRNQQNAIELTKKFKLKPKSKTNLGSVKLGMMVADTLGKNPLELVNNISKQEKKVSASTNNIFKPATLATTAPNNLFKNSYSMLETGVQSAHKTTKGKGTLICMLDTPVDIFHPTLSDALIETLDLVDFDPGNLETQVHGTSVAGILVSQNEHIGIAPKAKLLAISAFGAIPNHPHVLQGASDNIAKGLDRCIRQKADVINLSFTGGKDALVERLVKKAISKGITVVAAGGNGGYWGSTIYPALIPGVLAATAVDENKKLYPQANKGRFIDYSAPGVNVLTLAPGGKYQIATGTSLSSAHLSGIVALLLSQKKLQYALQPRNQLVNTILTQTAIDLGKPGRDQEYGEGLINATRALSQLKNGFPVKQSSANNSQNIH